MSATAIAEEDYLARERVSRTKHEYRAGVVSAIAGAGTAHNIIASNLAGMLYAALRGSACQPFGSDMQVKLRSDGYTYYYYPDAMIACDPTDLGDGWRTRPGALFEILSDTTRHIDDREKRMIYLLLESLEVYVRLEQTRPEVVIERRTAEGLAE